MVSVAAFAQQDGFYKDLFQDSGINLTSRVDLPAARFLGLRYETYYSAPHNPMEITAKDTVEQTRIMVGSEIDQNGVLLYPDGAPRFKMIYVNGGRATKHGNSLTEVGREHIRQFVAAGGSYVGSCAGSFIASMGNEAFKKDKNDPKAKHHITGNFADGSMKEEYLGVYPARTISTDRLEKDYYGYKVYTGIKVVKKSPLLKYFNFGGDHYIDSVYHNGGSWIAEDPATFAPGTEILLRYDYEPEKEAERVERGSFPVTDKINAWAYKKDAHTGRVVLTGSHPEGEISGDRLEMTSALFLYAIDGVGGPVVKASLENGRSRQMDKMTSDNDPAFTRIGDKQYHHFTVMIPKGARNITVTLESPYKEDDLYLTMRQGDFAFLRQSLHHDVALGSNKEMKFDSLKPGLWYIGVFCDTTVDTVVTDHGEEYTGHLEVLNGVPYTIKVTWE